MMKRFISICLAVILIFSCLTVTGFAADEREAPTAEETVIPDMAEEDEELEKINEVITELVTYFYNYATRPQEPAVGLETVIKITTIIVNIVYRVYKQQTQNAA